MKKLFITIVMVFMTMVGYAQTTFNVRIGGGFFQKVYDDYSKSYAESNGDAALALEANLPLGARTNRFVFSPSLFVVYDLEDQVNINIPLHFGYKVLLGNGALFVPKIGPIVGYNAYDEDFAYGPSTELSFEIKRFVVAANGYYDINSECLGAFCTIGYKF